LFYTIIDIETTGGNKNSGRITEIAAFRHDGQKLIDSFVSLVNPEVPIPGFIKNLTGISDEMVADAPKFAEIADELDRFTANSIFVAHNVNFDYYFIKEEFKKIGREFSRKKLCTVQLSRKTFPGLPSYSLGKITKQLNISLEGHHRAEADARATLELFEKILQNQPGKGLFESNFGIEEIASIPSPLIDKDLLLSIPDECGVFRLFDKYDEPLFIKRAGELLNAISAKLRPNGSNHSTDLLNEVYRIDWTHTGSALAAQLIEANEVLKFRPRYNYGKFSMKVHYGIVLEDRPNSFRLVLKKRKKETQNLFVFSNFYEGFDRLKELSDKSGSNIKSQGDERFKTHFLEFHKAEYDEYEVLKRLNGEDFWVVDEGKLASERTALKVEAGFPISMGTLNTNNYHDLRNAAMDDYSFESFPELEMILRNFISKNRFEQIIRN
jgi:DNA polymerase-3 subunit epsilon